MNLQAALSAASAMPPTPGVIHHPITCGSDVFYFDEDNNFGCEHAEVPAGDERTQMCLNHSIALLIIELGRNL